MPGLFGHVLHPDRYAWHVLMPALDILITVTVLVHLGMREADTIAQWSITPLGTWGLIGLSFLSVVVMICEYVGRRDAPRGRRLTVVAIAVSALPVNAALVQVAYLAAWGDVYGEPSPPPPGP